MGGRFGKKVVKLSSYYTPSQEKRNSDVVKSFIHLVKQYNKIFTSVNGFCAMNGFVALMHEANSLSESGRSDEIPSLVQKFIEENERSEQPPVTNRGVQF